MSMDKLITVIHYQRYSWAWGQIKTQHHQRSLPWKFPKTRRPGDPSKQAKLRPTRFYTETHNFKTWELIQRKIKTFIQIPIKFESLNTNTNRMKVFPLQRHLEPRDTMNLTLFWFHDSLCEFSSSCGTSKQFPKPSLDELFVCMERTNYPYNKVFFRP